MSDHPKITILPGTRASARAVLAQALEEVTDDTVAVVVLITGDQAHVLTSQFKTRDLCWAAALVQANAQEQATRG